jgi:hypothetical protein
MFIKTNMTRNIDTLRYNVKTMITKARGATLEKHI